MSIRWDALVVGIWFLVFSGVLLLAKGDAFWGSGSKKVPASMAARLVWSSNSALWGVLVTVEAFRFEVQDYVWAMLVGTGMVLLAVFAIVDYRRA
jgi:hypothetical protein